MQAVGISRAVLVQPSVYGTDNRALLDALKVDSADTLRGIVVVPPDLDDIALDRMHDLGVRGVRVNPMNANGLPLSAVTTLDRRLYERGWHLQLQIDVERCVDLEERLALLTVPVVIDHFGFVDVKRGCGGEGFARLRRLVERGTCYVKISAPYRLSAFDRVPYPDMSVLAHALVEANPHRVLWATDWPHTDLLRPMPDDADLARLVAEWIPDETNRQRVLADNPSALYWSR
jgi:2-pyrone-4,6-dicarboxylate lactonase